MKVYAGILLACLAVPAAHGNSTRTLPFEWKEELAGFKLPPDFTIELVGSEEDGIVKPIDITFDDAGRLWTQTAVMYPLDPASRLHGEGLERLRNDEAAQRSNPEFKRVLDLYQGKTRGEDKILIIPDPYKKEPSKPLVWADGLAIPQTMLPYKNGAYVAQGSELFLLEDTNADGKADQRVPLLTGFGIVDTHTMSHTFVRAPGGWLNFSHGGLNTGEVTSLVSGAKIRVDNSKIVRMSMDGAQMNVVTAGLNNIWGFQLRANGQWYGTEANDVGWSVLPLEEGSGLKGIGDHRIRPYQPWIPELHEFRVGGTGISGLAFAEDAANSFPAEWRDVALLANPITSAINAVRIVRNADGSVTATHLPDFVTSLDNWFRPVNIEFGPDGCLYVADWYNKIISHNEVALDHPARDKTRGRIWRICHKGQQPREIPNLYTVKNAELPAHLQSPSLWEKRAAWHQIVDRNAKELSARLVAMAGDPSQDTITRIHGLWSVEGLGHYDEKLMNTLLAAADDDLRREAVRALASYKLKPATLAKLLAQVKNDKNAMVRSQVLRTVADAKVANDAIIDLLVSFCQPDLPGIAMGGSYERKFERYLARMALEQYPVALSSYLQTRSATSQPPAHLFWATQALPQAERERQFLALWPAMQKEPIDEANFVVIAQSLDNPQIEAAVTPLFNDTKNASKLAQFAKQNYASIQSPALAKLMQPSVLWLLQRGDKDQLKLGLDVAGKLEVPGVRHEIVRLARSRDADVGIATLALIALDKQPKENQEIFSETFARDELPFGVKLRALNSLAKADVSLAQRKLESRLKSLDASQRRLVVTDFSGSPWGATLLFALLDKKLVTNDDFDLFATRRLFKQNPNDRRAQALVATLQQREQERSAAIQKKVQRLAQLAQRGRGNPAAGETFFNAICLACHVAGSKGAGFAPALDGSAHRDNEGLLTAIYDPDAAIESGYALFSVVKKDGQVLDGYLKKYEPGGITLQFMGGGETFVAMADVQEAYFNPGRSVMPRGLMDSLPDEQVEDVLAYIRTLK